MAAPPSSAKDVAEVPPPLDEQASPSGRYVIEIRLREHANVHAARSTATLWRVAGSQRETVWTRELPHRPRPRFAAVGDGGQVLLLDEWLRVRSDLAVTLVGAGGKVVAQHDLEAVRAALGVPISALAPVARHGVWIQAPPTIAADGDIAEVPAAGRLLRVDLRSGALSSR